MTVAEIRAKYPKPVKAPACEVVGDRYCVLGAACRMVGDDHRAFKYADSFPQPEIAAEVLNISVPEARQIAKANDNRQFGTAWRLLDKALKNKK